MCVAANVLLARMYRLVPLFLTAILYHVQPSALHSPMLPRAVSAQAYHRRRGRGVASCRRRWRRGSHSQSVFGQR